MLTVSAKSLHVWSARHTGGISPVSVDRFDTGNGPPVYVIVVLVEDKVPLEGAVAAGITPGSNRKAMNRATGNNLLVDLMIESINTSRAIPSSLAPG